MFILQGVSYTHPDRDMLFADLNVAINKHDKIALIGNNGAGKSTLLKLMAGILEPTSGMVQTDHTPYYVPQHFGQFNKMSIAEALGIDIKINALYEILGGHATSEQMDILADDWDIEERYKQAFAHWGLSKLNLKQLMGSLSGGQKTKVFLAGIDIHQPKIVLLDEPSNHLDVESRNLLYNYISKTNQTLVVVSHDRKLLNLLHTVYELSRSCIKIYGGNYEFYVIQKDLENEAMSQDLKSKEKALRKAREIEREALERQQKLDARGKKKQEKAGVPTIFMNTLKNNAEKSTSKMKDVHAEKIEAIKDDVGRLRRGIAETGKMKIGFEHSGTYKGKTLVSLSNINFKYDITHLWDFELSLDIRNGDRIVIKGNNGSGKSTLIKLILGELAPDLGKIDKASFKAIVLDQDYSLINDNLSIYEQAQQFNTSGLLEHEVKLRLNRFLFAQANWHKSCSSLSGGERMRLALCGLTMNAIAPDMIVLDEPTNNLDIHNLEILTAAITEYKGTLILVSHDTYFLDELKPYFTIDLSP